MSLSSGPMSSQQDDGKPEPMDILLNMSSPANRIQDCNSQARQEVEDDSQQYNPRSIPIVVDDPEILEKSIEELCRFALLQYNLDVAEEPHAQPLSDNITPVVETTDNVQVEELVTLTIPNTDQESIQKANPDKSLPQLDLQDATDNNIEQPNMESEFGLSYCILNATNGETQPSLVCNQVVVQNNEVGSLQPADVQYTNEETNVLTNDNLILQTAGPLNLVIPTELTSNITPQTRDDLNNAQTYLILGNIQHVAPVQNNVQLTYSSQPVIHILDVTSPIEIVYDTNPNNTQRAAPSGNKVKKMQEIPVTINLVDDTPVIIDLVEEPPVTINLGDDIEDAVATAEPADYSKVDQYIQAVSNLVDSDTHECFLCDFSGKSENSLRNHIAYRHPSKRQVLKCKHCPYVTDFKDYLSHHIREQHTRSETHRCSPCSFETKRIRSLKKHMRCGHQTPQYYNCSQCVFQTKYKENATKHKRHVHDKSYLLLNCYNCDFSTAYGCSMRRHVRTIHKIQEPKVYGCSQCEFRCGYMREMMYHVRATHPKQPELFKCKRCDFSSATKSAVKDHVRSKHKHDERALQCKICYCETRSLDSLRKHIKAKHAIYLKQQ